MANENKETSKSVKAPEKATAQSTAGQQAPQPDPTALSIGDLKTISTIFDVASTRGAFKASEMAGVGYIYNKLQAFLAKVAPEQAPEGTTAGAPTTVAPATAGGK